MRARFLPAVCVLIVLSAGSVRAQDEAGAEERFRAGAEAYARGEFRAAATAFEQAHRLAPRGPTILNAARAWESAEQPAPAADAYEAALDVGGLAEAESQLARDRLTALERDLAVVSVEGPRGCVVSVGHRDKAAIPTRIHLAPGAHSLTAHFSDGRSQVRQLELRRGETSKLVFEQPPPPRKRRAPKTEPSRPPPAPVVSHEQRTVGFVLMGVGVVASGAAIYLGVTALDARDTYTSSGRSNVDAYDRAKRLRLLTNVAWAGAAAAGGTGLVLVLTAPGGGAPERQAFVGYVTDL